jgi:hypothetical protein
VISVPTLPFTRLRGATAAAVVVLVALALAPAVDATAVNLPAKRTAAPGTSPSDPTSARDEQAKLRQGWRTSPDQLWVVRGDATGLHLLSARESEAYTWRTVASLSEPGVETDRWVGSACLTASGDHAVVVYAPRAFTNSASLYLRGGFVAVVDMGSGEVHKLPVQGNLAYYNPGCGAGEQAIVTASRFPEESGKAMATRLFRIDAGTRRVEEPIELAGQISSAVPMNDGIVATRGRSLVKVDSSGVITSIAKESKPPFMLKVDKDGGVVYLTGTRDQNSARRVVAGGASVSPQTLATSKGEWLGLRAGTDGRVFVLGRKAVAARRVPGVEMVATSSRDEVSTSGHLTLVHESMPNPRSEPEAWEKAQTLKLDADGAQILRFETKVRPSGETLRFELSPGVRSRPAMESGGAARTASRMAVTTSVTGTVESSATCSVPRNDPKTQVYQPTPRQVEWAADQAVVNNLKTARPANWKKSGLTSWTPQLMFPSTPLASGGRVPVQVLLGILAQESNLWQASGHALSGEFANPLVGNYYGRTGDGWAINFADSDCGYGLGQVTDGMRKSSATPAGAPAALTVKQQRAIALDYETNIARSLQILQDKWNKTYSAGLRHANGSPNSIENWFFAIWAYNSGFYPNKNNGTPWGVGWFNNPANPIYPVNRGFFNEDPSDPAHPADWPYQEKVIGWAAYSIATPDGVGFRTAWWISSYDRDNAKPAVYTFCDPVNYCSPGDNPCPSLDSKCWWHTPVTFNDCANGYCGHELLRFDTTYPEQPDGTHYPPNCTLTGLPTGSLIIDDVPSSAPAPRAGCGHPWTDRGKFSLTFASASGRIDFHQIGGGFGGHFWFAHTRTSTADGGAMNVTGKWTYTTAVNSWGRLMVHMPDHGAETQQAAYKVNVGNGTIKTRYALQRTQAHRWVSLGVMKFSGYPSVSLSSTTWDGSGSDDIAFDAIAIKPLAAKPRHFVVAMGDSFASGEGANDSTNGDDYYKETDFGGVYGKDDARRNACHRSPYAWSRKALLADSSQSIGYRANSWDATLDYQFVACSGAESQNILPYHVVPAGSALPTNAEEEKGDGQYGEVSQIDKGYLDANTTLVMFSIGGNDAQFGPVIAACVNPFDIGDDCTKANTTGDGPNDEVIPELIRTKVKSSVRIDVQQIHKYAPNAKILLMGYPQLISDGGNCMGAVGLSENEAAWIDDMSVVMDAALAELVSEFKQQAMKIAIGAPIGDFWNKGVCGNPEEINAVVSNRTAGDQPLSASAPASQQSFHPKIGGTTLYANAANRALRELGL